MYKFIAITMLCLLYTASSICAKYDIKFSNNYPPYNYIDENGKLVGFSVDVLDAITNIYNIDIQVSRDKWTVINQQLKDGEIHAVAGAHFPGGIDNEYTYTRSIISTAHCFLYNSNHIKRFSLERFRSINEPLVALWENDVLIHYIHSINPTAKFIFIKDYEPLLKTLDRSDVTCVFAQRVGGLFEAEKLEMDYVRALDHRILERNMGFKVSKNCPELAELLNNGIEVILANGEYERIYDKWIKKYAQQPVYWYNNVRVLAFIGSIISFLILLLVIANRILNSKIKIRTQDLQRQLDVNSRILKELEKQKTKAEESDRMKSAFLANMSHEIRTPMNGIIGFSELLKTSATTPEEQKHFIDVIQQSGFRMLATINNIIDISKLESGIEKPRYTLVDISRMLTELHDFFLPETNSKGIQLLLKETVGINNIPFYTDEHKINSIFTNLIKNAIKFTSDGSITITYSVNNDEAEFWITDTGIGIVKDKQALIFDQFVQADISHSRDFEGSGLGLSITKGYVELLNGDIQLDSEPLKGTTFYIRIPNHKFTNSN